MTHISLSFPPVGDDFYGDLLLNRPDKANAFNGEMIREITDAIHTAKNHPRVRFLVLRGAGKHFSAGADLGWMKNSASLSYQENLREAQTLREMFIALRDFPAPTMAVVHGAIYGGAVGLAATADITIAPRDARFCLSEVQVGLLPAVIAPFLQLKLSPGTVRHLGLTGKVFSGEEAKSLGLVQVLTQTEELYQTWQEEGNHILKGGPQAQKAYKILLRELSRKNGKNDAATLTTEAIARVRTQPEGQAGLKSFLEQSTPPWREKLAVEGGKP